MSYDKTRVSIFGKIAKAAEELEKYYLGEDDSESASKSHAFLRSVREQVTESLDCLREVNGLIQRVYARAYESSQCHPRFEDILGVVCEANLAKLPGVRQELVAKNCRRLLLASTLVHYRLQFELTLDDAPVEKLEGLMHLNYC